MNVKSESKDGASKPTVASKQAAPWFYRRPYGMGFSVASSKGWIATGVVLVLVFGSVAILPPDVAKVFILVVAVAFYILGWIMS
jgi:hypothetical protein|tara:strand:- start:191 stop:442 length:252 start_codon:yes stop_codon:yes gene_type:complete